MIRAFQWDLARQVERLDWLLAQLPRYAAWGYQELYLHLEDAVDYPSLPGVARADAYSWREFEKLAAAAARHGIGLVPIINLLGHTQYLIKTETWRDLNELRDPTGAPLPRGQICPLHPRTPEVAARLLRDVAPFCTTGKVHVGLDESFHLGRHPLSQAEVAEVGLARHFARHVARLHQLAAGHGLRLGLWADMLALLPEAIPLLPRDVIAYDWYYYGFRRHPRVELCNFAEVDLATPLRARGIEYWGCPMNGAFRHEPLPVFGDRLGNAASWWRRCHEVGAAGFLVTSWEANRLAVDLTTVVDAAIADFWLAPGSDDHPTMLAHGFERALAAPAAGARRAARVALAADEYSFSGYARWETNDRWQVVSTREGLERWRQEWRRHERWLRMPDLPAPLQPSLAFRCYLAARDTFVREAAAGVFRLRRQLERVGGPGAHGVGAAAASPADTEKLLRALERTADAFRLEINRGRRAARAMWRATRSAREAGPNERQLQADRARLHDWRRWLARFRRDPTWARTSSPVAGAWQLQLVVVNFEPALQRIEVEQQQPDGTWLVLGGRHTIEFRTAAARPRANVRRSLVVPLDDPRRPLRLGLRGCGRVAVTQVELTDGVRYRRLPGSAWNGRRILGRPPLAPGLGWPDPWAVQERLELEFGEERS